MRYEFSLIIRMVVAFVLTIKLFHAIFAPLTLEFSYLLLKLLGYSPILSFVNSSIVISQNEFLFIPACIAASAYFLFMLLIMLTKDIEWKTRIYMMIFGCLLILAMNVIRVDILVILFVDYSKHLFETIHMFFWRFVSGVYVALIWILAIYVFKIKSIPIYDDIKELFKSSLFNKKKEIVKKKPRKKKRSRKKSK